MASIGREGERGRLKRILFRDARGKQQSLRLGDCTERTAQNALVGFERVLEAHRVGSTIHPDGVRWLESIDDRIHARVARLGLTEPRKPAEAHRLGALLDRFEAASVVKPGTQATYRQSVESIRSHFGTTTPLREITPAAADEWRKAMAEPVEGARRLAGATIAKRVRVAKSIFQKAVKWGMLPSNPFGDLRAGAQSNPDRAHYVTREATTAILAACPDAQWRAIVALCRYAGLRCPSELVGLRWGDVNWDRLRLTVRSPKTAGLDGHAVRVVPIAPELRAILQDLYDLTPGGTVPVIPRLQDPATNLRTTFGKIVTRAGLTPWPRLFHALRASCATDWVEQAPAHAVARWLGHSPLIAASHYLHTRDAHFDLVTGRAEAAANPATQARPRRHTGPQHEDDNPENPRDLVGVGTGCDPVGNEAMTLRGFEPPPDRPVIQGVGDRGGSNSGNRAADSVPQHDLMDPRLAKVVANWGLLAPAIRAAIVALTEGA